jgi:transposase-like protein
MWLTVKEMAGKLGVSTKTIRRKISKGEWETKEVAGKPGKKMILVRFIKLDTATLDTAKLDTAKLDTVELDTVELDTPDQPATKTFTIRYIENFDVVKEDIELPCDHGLTRDIDIDCPFECKYAILPHPMDSQGRKYCTVEFIAKYGFLKHCKHGIGLEGDESKLNKTPEPVNCNETISSPEESEAVKPEAALDSYLSMNDCARQLGIHPRTLRNWVRDGKCSTIPNPNDKRQNLVEVNSLPDQYRAQIISQKALTVKIDTTVIHREKMIQNYFKVKRLKNTHLAKRYIETLIEAGMVGSVATFYRWIKEYDNKGLSGIKRKKRKDSGIIRKPVDPEAKRLFAAYVLARGDWNVEFAIRDFNPELINKGFEPLTRIQAERIIDERQLKDSWTINFKKGFSRNMMPSVIHQRGINPPNTIWQVDDHDQDLLVAYQGKEINLFKEAIIGFEEYIDKKTGEIKNKVVRPKAIRVIDPNTNMIMGDFLTGDTYGSYD